MTIHSWTVVCWDVSQTWSQYQLQLKSPKGTIWSAIWDSFFIHMCGVWTQLTVTANSYSWPGTNLSLLFSLFPFPLLPPSLLLPLPFHFLPLSLSPPLPLPSLSLHNIPKLLVSIWRNFCFCCRYFWWW